MSTPTLTMIGHANFLEDVTPTTDGTNVANVSDWLMHDVWTSAGTATSFIRVDMTTAQACDYWAIAGHDLPTQTANVVLQWSDNDAAWNNATEIVTPSTGAPIMRYFPSLSHRYWRLLFSSLDAAAFVAVASFGARLDLPRGPQRGFMPPPYSRRDRILPATTQSGAFLGQSLIRTGITGSLDLRVIDYAEYVSDIEPFVLHARGKAWFLLWDPAGHPDDVALCRTTKTPTPASNEPGRLDVSIGFEGIAT